MEATIENERLLLLVTDAPSAGPPTTWLSELPYLSSLAERGTWAQVNAPTVAPAPAIWPSFATGVAIGQGMDEGTVGGEPFWRPLEEGGKRVVVHGAPLLSLPAQQLPSASSGDPHHLVAKADWQFMMLLHQASFGLPPDRSVGGASARQPALSPRAGLRGRAGRWAAFLLGRGGKAPATVADDPRLGHWQRWDKEIAPLALAAGPQTAVMVLGLPSGKGDDGLLVAGGGFIASSGDLGTIDLLDLPPTILWLLDVPPPTKMTGRVLDEIWQPEAGWTDEEQEALSQHLRGLGYLS